MWNSRGHVCVCVRLGTGPHRGPLCGPANPPLHDNDILRPITPAANSAGHDGEEHTVNPVSIIDTTGILKSGLH